jgi:carboxymethylenebutenolidase
MTAIEIEHVSYQGAHGTIAANIARPEGGVCPAVILLQEGIGVTDHLRELARRFAQHGYLTLVPDLYSRDAARKQLADDEVIRSLPLARAADREARIAGLPWHEQESARRVIAWFQGRDTSSYLDDARASLIFLRRHAQVDPHAIASVGFSLGGGLTFELASTHAELAAGVVFYGSAPERERLKQVRCPIEAHYAERDPAITDSAVAVGETLRSVGTSFRYFVYPDTQHGFVNVERPTFHPSAATLATARTLEFLHDKLRSRALGRGTFASARG